MQQRQQGYGVDHLLDRGNQPKSTLATLSNKEKTKKEQNWTLETWYQHPQKSTWWWWNVL